MGRIQAPLLLRDGSTSCEVSARRLRIVGAGAGVPAPELTSPVSRLALDDEPSTSIYTKCLVVHLDGSGGATYECRGATILSTGSLCVRSRGLTISKDLAQATSAPGHVRVRWTMPLAVNPGAPIARPADGPGRGRSLADAARWLQDAPPPFVLVRRFLTERGQRHSDGASTTPAGLDHFAGTLVASSYALNLLGGELTCRDVMGWASVSGAEEEEGQQRSSRAVTALSADEVSLSQRGGSFLSLRSSAARTRALSGTAATLLALRFGEAVCWRLPARAAARIVPTLLGTRGAAARASLDVSSEVPLARAAAAAASRPGAFVATAPPKPVEPKPRAPSKPRAKQSPELKPQSPEPSAPGASVAAAPPKPVEPKPRAPSKPRAKQSPELKPQSPEPSPKPPPSPTPPRLAPKTTTPVAPRPAMPAIEPPSPLPPPTEPKPKRNLRVVKPPSAPRTSNPKKPLAPLASSRGVLERTSVVFGVGGGAKRDVAVRVPLATPEPLLRALRGIMGAETRASGSLTLQTASGRSAGGAGPGVAGAAPNYGGDDLLDFPLGEGDAVKAGSSGVKSVGPETRVELHAKLVAKHVGVRLASGLQLKGGPLSRAVRPPRQVRGSNYTPPPPPHPIYLYFYLLFFFTKRK